MTQHEALEYLVAGLVLALFCVAVLWPEPRKKPAKEWRVIYDVFALSVAAGFYIAVAG